MTNKIKKVSRIAAYLLAGASILGINGCPDKLSERGRVERLEKRLEPIVSGFSVSENGARVQYLYKKDGDVLKRIRGFEGSVMIHDIFVGNYIDKTLVEKAVSSSGVYESPDGKWIDVVSYECKSEERVLENLRKREQRFKYTERNGQTEEVMGIPLAGSEILAIRRGNRYDIRHVDANGRHVMYPPNDECSVLVSQKGRRMDVYLAYGSSRDALGNLTAATQEDK